MKIYPYLSYSREINETGLNWTCNLQKAYGSITINLYLVYNSNDQRRVFDTMECDHREKGEGKRTILRYFILLDKVFLEEVLSLLPYE